MPIYFIKEKNKLFRFASFFDLENYLGKEVKHHTESLAKLITTHFPTGKLRTRAGAFIDGWIDTRGEAVPSLMKGNNWRPDKKWRV